MHHLELTHMLLAPEEANLVFKLHCALMQYVNEQLKVASADGIAAPYTALPAEQRQKVVQAFVGHQDLIDAFIATNPAQLFQEELGVVSTWRHLVSGRFIALRQLKEHMIPNGALVDIRQQSVAMQRAAFKQGLIPFVPADRAAAAVQEQVAASPSRRLFQLKITLRGTEPLVWRRIQVWDDTLDKLHEHIQIAMGWTNSHLHQFLIQGQLYGDPELLDHGPEPLAARDSTKTLLSAVMPTDGSPLSFQYEYDFGDGWMHDVLFEGSPAPQPGVIYPQCLEGERACPPEDVGGIHGYADYREAIADPSHERHQELLNWSGPFNPNKFNARLTTHVMQEGIPDWRKMK